MMVINAELRHLITMAIHMIRLMLGGEQFGDLAYTQLGASKKGLVVLSAPYFSIITKMAIVTLKMKI